MPPPRHTFLSHPHMDSNGFIDAWRNPHMCYSDAITKRKLKPNTKCAFVFGWEGLGRMRDLVNNLSIEKKKFLDRHLTKRERDILLNRIASNGATSEEIGRKYGVTRERINQREKHITFLILCIFHMNENLLAPTVSTFAFDTFKDGSTFIIEVNGKKVN